MATSVVMPALEMAQETGKLVSWLKKEGEPVKKGEGLRCEQCKRVYPVRDDIPIMLPEEATIED